MVNISYTNHHISKKAFTSVHVSVPMSVHEREREREHIINLMSLSEFLLNGNYLIEKCDYKSYL